jgi:translation initiation factor IF-3
MRSGTNVNRDIKAPRVLLIDENGKNHGNVSTKDALYKARAADLDLVEVNSGGKVPVCKIMDYGKWKYEQDKRKKKNTSTKTQTKEMKFRPNTCDNDLTYRAKQTDKFLNSGNRVKLVVRFKGREQEHIYVTGKSLLERFLELLTAKYYITSPVKLEERSIVLLLMPGDVNGNNN